MSLDRETLAIAPSTGAHAEIGRYLWMMEAVRAITKRDIEGISQAALDWSAAPAANSIGTLLYHIALVEADWLYMDALAQPFPPEIASLLTHDSRDARGHLAVITGVTLAEHLARLDTVRAFFLAEFGAMSLETFRTLRTLPEYHVTPEWIAYHLIEHEAGHRGEIATIRTLAEIALSEG
jgi:uncharacterized damage-inducible protein DinB